PVVQLATTEVAQVCQPGEIVQGQLALRTSARKWIYAHAESDAPWLRLAEQHVSGPQQAVITFEAHSQHLQPGRVHEGNLKITANAGQVLHVPVHLEVRQVMPRGAKRAPQPIVVGAAAGLVFRLLLVPVADLMPAPWSSAE